MKCGLKTKRHSTIWLYFAMILFLTVMVAFLIISAVWFALYKMNITGYDPHGRRAPLLLFFIGSLALGGMLAIFVGKVIIAPVKRLGDAFREVSRGNFDVKVPEREPIREMRDIAMQFNAMTYDLAHIETMRSDFVANVSHEFKTPISSIEGYATLLQSDDLSEEKRKRYTDKILDNTKRLSSLCSNILLLSRLENLKTVPDKRRFRLDEQIRKTVLMLEDMWESKDIKFDIEMARTMYYGSEGLLGHVWSNLLSNAIKHSHSGGVIGIKISEEVDRINVEISDEGDGMSDEVMKHIFEKFYQGDQSRTADGNGLGLALVKRVLDISHADISVCSKVGEGSVFCVALPIEE